MRNKSERLSWLISVSVAAAISAVSTLLSVGKDCKDKGFFSVAGTVYECKVRGSDE